MEAGKPTLKRIFIHGFLGLGDDWKRIAVLPNDAVLHSLWDDIARLKNVSFETWTERFLSSYSGELEVYAYSMGGRLALHAAIQDPKRFRKITLFSSHFGLQKKEERLARLQHDKAWAKAFLTENWNDLMLRWNSQEVFKNSQAWPRQEAHFHREHLAIALESFSLGKQHYLLEKMQEVPNLHYCVGEYDTKFMSLLSAVQKTKVQGYALPRSGHRIPWDYCFSGGERWWLC